MDALTKAGIRVERAIPGSRMPELQSPAAAVQLAELDQAGKTATVLITILAPARLGAESCETLAVAVSDMILGLGGSGVQGKTEHVNGTTLLQTPISAVFAGRETAAGWEAHVEEEPTFSVKLGSKALSSAVGFTAWREEEEVDEVLVPVANATWHFKLEELFPLDKAEEAAPEEPFVITVSRTGRTETYSGCTLTVHKRVITKEGQSQIREGVATSLSVN